MNQSFKTTRITDTTETPITPAGGAGVYENLVHLNIHNGGPSAVTVTVRDSIGGAVRFTYTVKPGESIGFNDDAGNAQASPNTAWTAQSSIAADITVNAGWM